MFFILHKQAYKKGTWEGKKTCKQKRKVSSDVNFVSNLRNEGGRSDGKRRISEDEDVLVENYLKFA